jgi:phosphate/sulfate permease
MTGFCIGTISLANILGVAYSNKVMSLKKLLYLTLFFEALGMVLISRFTLNKTITLTVNFEKITNLRMGFICLGSTQMCSALIMICILIFSLPMSTTQVVISGLTGLSIIYLTGEETKNHYWFLEEALMWIFLPIVALIMAHAGHSLVKRYIFENSEARRRILVLIPYQMMLSFYCMFYMGLSKIYKNSQTNHGIQIAFWCVIVIFPFICLAFCRLFMMRKAR